MHNIEMHAATDEFRNCWSAAGRHLQSQAQGGQVNWLKADLNPPFLEHLSFRLGNQLLFVRLIDVDRNLKTPGNDEGFKKIAKESKGHACYMPMKKTATGWQACRPQWGLVEASSGQPLNPVSLISEEKIEMTDWELLDFAVQVVTSHITKELGKEIMSSQSNPAINPSIWFVGDNGPEWVVVRAVRYPKLHAVRPENIHEIAAYCANQGKDGHFASVSVANSEDPFDPASDNSALPLWRGYGLLPRFRGLLPATIESEIH